MFGAAAGFCSGALAGHQCQKCHAAACEGLATVQGAEPAADFKLLVHILGASIPELETPGLLLKQRPRAEAGLGRLRRETCYAEYLGEEGDIFERAAAGLDGLLGVGSCRVSVEGRGAGGLKSGREGELECPWRFGDTLTLDARVSDVTGPGLKVCLRADSEVRLGRLAVRLRSWAPAWWTCGGGSCPRACARAASTRTAPRARAAVSGSRPSRS